MRAYMQFESGDDHLRLGAIFSLPATWWQRACSGQSCARISEISLIFSAISASACIKRKPKRRGFSGNLRY